MRRNPGPPLATLLVLAFAAAFAPPLSGADLGDGPAVGDAPRDSAPWQLDWARGAVFYEVFVRSFADSDGDGIGDLPGLTAKLDYLNDGRLGGDDLGIDGIWLMPVFDSPSYHGYDTVDYERIEPDYGSAEQFAAFLEAARVRGIKVIVDLVLNHTSSQHPWFLEASGSRHAPRRSWYVWRPDDPGWTQPWGGSYPVWHESGGEHYYGVFWSGMPDLNWRQPEVRAEMLRLAELWIARGVDGFRLDATRHLVENGPGQLQVDQPETLAALREFAGVLRRRHPEILLVGENWTDPGRVALYFGDDREVRGGDGLASSFDFALAGAIVEAARTGDVSGVVTALAATAALYPAGALNATFLTNHDMARLTTQLAGDEPAQRRAAALLLTLPGIPFLYYGEEIGLENGPSPRDQDKRTPMPWTAAGPGHGFTTATAPWHPFAGDPTARNVAAQLADPASLLAHYRHWIALRARERALRDGDLFLLPGGPDGVLAFLRRAQGERLLVVHGFASRPSRTPLPFGCGALDPLVAPASARLIAGAAGSCELALDGADSWVGRVRPVPH